MTVSVDPTPEPERASDLFVDFANTLSFDHGEPIEGLPDTDALLTWLRQHELLSDRARAAEAHRLAHSPAEAARRMERFRYLRSLLQEMAGRLGRGDLPTREELRRLNHILKHGLHYHQLEAEADGARYSLAQVGDRLDQARAAIAGSFAYFLAEGDPSRLRVCANDGCREVFVDRSPTGRRRWCTMRVCGNQAKVARHRARQRSHLPVEAGAD